LERDIDELILEIPEEVLADLEDECRERCVSLEFLIVDRMNAARDAGVDPAKREFGLLMVKSRSALTI
jgi:hypothetical protein